MALSGNMWQVSKRFGNIQPNLYQQFPSSQIWLAQFCWGTSSSLFATHWLLYNQVNHPPLSPHSGMSLNLPRVQVDQHLLQMLQILDQLASITIYPLLFTIHPYYLLVTPATLVPQSTHHASQLQWSCDLALWLSHLATWPPLLATHPLYLAHVFPFVFPWLATCI